MKDIEIEGKTFVLSDLHLKKGDPRKKLFIEFIKEHTKKGNIILVGDIFDIWIGRNKEMQGEFKEFISSIEKSNNQVIYVEGNHDFHLTYLDEIGIPRMVEGQITINGKKFFVSHGDMYSLEITHRAYRKVILKSEKIFKILANGYFDSSINKIGELFTLLSRTRYKNPQISGKRKRIFSSMLSNAFKIAKGKNFDGVIFGHCHIPYLVELEGKKYINPGFWGKDEGTYIEIDEDDIRIKTIRY